MSSISYIAGRLRTVDGVSTCDRLACQPFIRRDAVACDCYASQCDNDFKISTILILTDDSTAYIQHLGSISDSYHTTLPNYKDASVSSYCMTFYFRSELVYSHYNEILNALQWVDAVLEKPGNYSIILKFSSRIITPCMYANTECTNVVLSGLTIGQFCTNTQCIRGNQRVA